MFGSTSSTGTSWGGFGAYQDMGMQGRLSGRMQPPVYAGDVMRMAMHTAQALWPDAPRTLAVKVLAPLLGALGREVNIRQLPIEFDIERSGYQQTVKPRPKPAPPDGEWPVDWFTVVETQRERL